MNCDDILKFSWQQVKDDGM